MVKRYFILWILFFVFARHSYAQNETQKEQDTITTESIFKKAEFFKKGKTVYIGVYETTKNNRTSHILISYGEGITEFIEMRNAKETKSTVNLVRIHYVLAKFLSQGYTIINSTSSANAGLRHTTYLLQKDTIP
jgi:hypothetical protein